MKKRITAIITVLMMLPTVALASLEATLDNETDMINICGESDKNNVSAVLINPGYDLSATEENDETLSDAVLFYRPLDVEYGVYEYSIKMPSTAEKGRYTLYVDSEEKVLYYAPVAERLSMVAEVKTAIEEDALAEYLSASGAYLCDAEKFLSVENVSNVATLMKDFLYETTLVENSPESLGAINESLNFAVTVELLNEEQLSSINEIIGVIDDTEMAIKYSEHKDKIPASKQDGILDRISGKALLSKDAFYKSLQESIFISVINESKSLSSTKKREFFDEYAANVNLNISDYSSLTGTERNSVVAQVAAAKKNTISDMQTKLDELCGDYDSEGGSDGGYVGNEGGGSGISAGGMGGGKAPEVVVNPVENKKTFSDMESYSWAEEAVSTLSGRKIINGYEDGTFKPEGNITRGEFTAMIARAFLPQYSGGSKDFEDVAVGDWYYSSVMSALENKIVSGIGEGKFLPDEKICRADMAVILSNLLTYKGKILVGGENSFVDAEAIAEYAKNAVSILNKNGIINGDDNNKFRPNDFANRAEAAVMLNRFINLIEGEGTK